MVEKRMGTGLIVKPHHVRQAYTRRRRRITPFYKPADRWQKCWKKTADKLNSEGIEVTDYIEAQFRYIYPFPHPNVLYGDKAMHRYNCYKNLNKKELDGFKDDANKRFLTMVDLLDRKMSMGFTPEHALSKRAFTFTPLFRVAICKKLTGNIEAVKVWEEAARKEYNSHPVYQTLYDDWSV